MGVSDQLPTTSHWHVLESTVTVQDAGSGLSLMVLVVLLYGFPMAEHCPKILVFAQQCCNNGAILPQSACVELS